MDKKDIIEHFERIQSRLGANLPEKFRPFLKNQKLNSRGGIVVGPRGVGKTTWLLKESLQEKLMYFSVDNPLVAQTTLSDLADAAFGRGYVGVLFDEVHYAQNWSQHVKAIYDSYPDKKIWISDSCSLILRMSSADLTRRFPRKELPFLSFREYIALKYDVDLNPFDPFDSSYSTFKEVLSQTNILEAFQTYKKEGFRPIFLEGEYSERILAIIEKTIFHDIPFFLPQVQDSHLRLMSAVIGYLALSPIPTVNIESLSREWSVSKEKIYNLFEVMEHVGLLNIIRYPKDHKTYSKGAKIFLADPSMYLALGGPIGNVREAFVAAIFRQMKKDIYACKNEQRGDFTVEDKVFEVGGRNKSQKGSDYVLRDEVDMPTEKSIPLWSLGLMY